MINSSQSLEGVLPPIPKLSVGDDELPLITAAQEQPELFGRLYERYVDRMFRYMELRAGTSDAADLTQQVFLKAFASLPKYKARHVPFSAWLFRIGRNVAIDHRRRSRRTPDELLPTIAQPASSSLSPEDAAVKAEMVTRLRELIGELNIEKRDLLALRFAAGLNSRQIAAVVGKTEAGVKKQLTRILHNIKENYGEPYRIS